MLLMVMLNPSFGQLKDTNAQWSIGQGYELYSQVLKENRPIYVHLPEGYNEHIDKKYDVIYLLDGEQNFLTATSISSFLGRGGRGKPSEAPIVVAIPNTDRTRDLTPTSAISRRGAATLENSGRGESFIAFMEKELIPTVESTYRVTDRRVLIGHSFGGLLTVYTLLHHPDVFTDYLAIDPSFWWDDQKLMKEAEPLIEQLKGKNVNLYLARAGRNAHHDVARQKEDAKELQLDFKTMLEQKAPESLQWRYDNFEEESHGTIYFIGCFTGLKYLQEEK
ncbi:hypothetical protein LVD15_24285 [Fulvivirga maritima]|uniref:alpha/beta hydrolase n=1 Tax=Fulvivirga maritima TaxID=2904247 RepID=UPI001EEAD631|nr:alpha/beta hydrolase-fold protein [Fulvivirga maritima]UII26379.1 hypothetical protein LVD15_24285 [Fulvivirga maritima]